MASRGCGTRIVLITQEAPLYLAELVAALLEHDGEDVCAATVLPPYGEEGCAGLCRRIASLYGPSAFLRLATTIALGQVSDGWAALRGRPPRYAVRGLLRRARTPLLETRDVNNPVYVERVRHQAPDVILSLACPQMLHAELLAVPRLGCVNYHSSLLPEYRGLFSPFWAMAEGASQTGVTVHWMTADLDAGAVVAQRALPILPGDSLHTLCRRSVSVGSAVLREALDRIRDGRARPTPVSEGRHGSYRPFPSAAEGRRFRQAGGRFF